MARQERDRLDEQISGSNPKIKSDEKITDFNNNNYIWIFELLLKGQEVQ
jgi:hypothetical protein